MGLTPLAIINEQCRQHEGQWLKCVKIHPMDFDALKHEFARAGFTVDNSARMRMGEVPIIMDETCLEGPVCEWDEWPLLYLRGS